MTGACKSRTCRTKHEWVDCEDCTLVMHCVYACPVPMPIYTRQTLRPPDADPLGYRTTTPAEIDNSVHPGAWKKR